MKDIKFFVSKTKLLVMDGFDYTYWFMPEKEFQEVLYGKYNPITMSHNKPIIKIKQI